MIHRNAETIIFSWAKVYIPALSNEEPQRITFPSNHSAMWPQILPKTIVTKDSGQPGGGEVTGDGTSAVCLERENLKKQEKCSVKTKLRNQHHNKLQAREDGIYTTLENNLAKANRQKVHHTDLQDA